MMRLWIPLLILIGVVHAQAPSELTLPALRERIRNADTGTADRLAAIESALGRFPTAPRELRDEFLKDGVAERIVEPVVEAFLGAEPLQYQDALGAICELTVSDNKSVADTVMRRISTATKRDPGGAQLRDLLIQWGRGEFKELNSATTREGVARALSAVHHRKALEALIDMWDQDADPKVRAEAGQRVQAMLPFSDAAAARRFLNLEKNRSKTFIALMLEQMEKQRTAFDVMRAERNEFLRKYLERESPQTAFVVLEEGDADKRRIAADRIHAFAKDWKLTNSAAKQFAKRATTAWVRESERQQLESSVLAPLTSTLTLLADQRHEEVLWEVAGFKDALDDKVRPLLMLDGVEQTVANLLQAYAPRYSGALQLLEQMAKYRDGAQDDDMRRRAAIVALGNLTSNDSLDVGPNLARVLAAERNPDLQSRLLNGLRGVANPKPAYEAAARILKEGTLKEGALRDCIKILSKIDTSGALQTLIDVAKSPPQGPAGGPNRRLQLDAIRDGLLARQYGADEQGQQSAFACLRELVQAETGDEATRLEVIAALGKHGQRNAKQLLLALHRDRAQLQTDADRTALAGAMLQLAHRLSSGGTADGLDPGDVEAAVALVAAAAIGTELEQLDALSKKLVGVSLEDLGSRVVRAADKAQRPAYEVRDLTMRAYALQPGADAKEVFARRLEAAEKAEGDGLTEKRQREMWTFIVDKLELDLAKGPAGAEEKKQLAEYLHRLAGLEEGRERGRRYLRAAELAFEAEDPDLLLRVLNEANKKKALSNLELGPWGEKYSQLKARLQEEPGPDGDS